MRSTLMRGLLARRALVLSSLALGACADGGSSAPGQKVSVQVAPLSLPGIGYACYDVKVATGLGLTETVWSQGDPGFTALGADQTAPAPGTPDATHADTTTICSNQYGNTAGGDITYIGTCDASVDSDGFAGNGVQNRVTIWVDGLYTASGAAMGEWQDPCPGGCALDIDCNENADSEARFDLTIMRDANQGFFDIAVNFSDIFCSSKLDTCYADGPDADAAPDPIELLFGADQTRDWTAVFGFACTGGPGSDVETTLLYSKVVVTCDGTEFVIDPKAADGNAEVTASGTTLHYGVYRGDELLDCGEEPCNKSYWNLAFDLADLDGFEGCSLALEATAHDGTGFSGGFPTADGLSYPYIAVAADLTDADGPICQQNPLNGVDALNDRASAVKTVYEGSVGGIAKPTAMCSQYAAGVVSDTGSCAATGPRVVKHTMFGQFGVVPFTAILTFDVNQPQLPEDPNDPTRGEYAHYSLTVDYGGQTWTEDPNSTFVVMNDLNGAYDHLGSNGTDYGYVGLNLTFPISALGSDGLPESIPVGDAFENMLIVNIPGAPVIGTIMQVNSVILP